MEGLGLAAGVIGVVQIAGTIVSMTYNYGKDCWDAKDDSKRLLAETKALKNVLEAAVALLESDIAAQRFPYLKMLLNEDPDGLLEVCHDEVASVDKALRKAWNSWCDNHHSVRGMAQLAKWPLKKKRLEHVLEGIHSLHGAVSQALALDTGRDVVIIHAAVSRLEDNMSNLTTVVEEIKHMATATGETMVAAMDTATRIEGITIDIRQEQAKEAARAEKEREQQRAAEERERAQVRHKEILRRLAPKDQERESQYAKHSRLRNARDSATSRWLLDGEPLSTVLQPDASPRTLWIKGKAGCGKSMLASAVIEHVRRKKNTALVFFYFDFNNGTASKSENMLLSLTVQLAVACDTLPAVLDQFAKDHLDTDGKVPPLDAVVQLLHDLVGYLVGHDNPQAVVVVIDALDECADRSALLQNLDQIRDWHLPLSVILTSHDLPYIAERLGFDVFAAEPSAEMIVVAADSKNTSRDIGIFVQNQLETDGDFTKWSFASRKKIAAALVNGSGGMFRWVACQLEMLRDCVTEDDLDSELASLPHSLSATYTAALRRVKTAHRPRVLRLLFWLVVAPRPPTLEEASDFLAVDLTDPTAGPDGTCYFKASKRTARLHDIALFCPTLIRPVKDILRKTALHLAHSTVKDYLERSSDLLEAFGPVITTAFSTALSTPPPLHAATILGAAHNYVCKTLLGYVGSWREGIQYSWRKQRQQQSGGEWPLRHVAAQWPSHFHSCCAAKSDDAELHDMVFSLFRVPSGQSAHVFANYLNATGRTFTSFPDGQGRRCSKRLVLACSYGLEDVVKRLLDEPVCNYETADDDRACLAECVVAAAWNYHDGALSLLLQSTSPADLGPVGSLLNKAARFSSRPGALRLLFDHLSRTGQLSARALDDALHYDFSYDYGVAFLVLIEAGARPSSFVLRNIINDGRHKLAMHGLPKAAERKLQRATIMLSGRSFDNRMNRRDEDDAPILELVAKRLPGRVFAWAAVSKHCRRLVGPSLCPPENVFAAACVSGQVAVARQMIETGAVDMNAPLWTVAGWAAYPLFVAVFAQQLEIAAVCLAHGAQVDQRGSTGSLYRPLSLAVLAKDVAMVQLLVKHGAALDTVCSEYGTPLQTSAFVGHLKITKCLCEHPGVGAGQTAAPKSPLRDMAHHYAYWTPLRIAIVEGHSDVAELLLRQNPEDGWAECPADVYSGADEVLARSWEVPRPLLVDALDAGEIHLVRQMLLNARVRDMDDEPGLVDPESPLAARRAVLAECLNKAAKHGYAEVAQQLLEAGADANARFKSRTPLTRACFALARGFLSQSYVEIVRALMAHSASIDVDDDVYDAFSPIKWDRFRIYDADRAVEALLLVHGWEGNMDFLVDTAAAVSLIVSGRSCNRLVALLLVRFAELEEMPLFQGFDPAMKDVPLDEDAIAAAVEELYNRMLGEVLPFLYLADGISYYSDEKEAVSSDISED